MEYKIFELKISEYKISELKNSEYKIYKLNISEYKIYELKLSELKIYELKLSELKIYELKLSELKISEYKISELKISEYKISELKISEYKISEFKISEVTISEHKISVSWKILWWSFVTFTQWLKRVNYKKWEEIFCLCNSFNHNLGRLVRFNDCLQRVPQSFVAMGMQETSINLILLCEDKGNILQYKLINGIDQNRNAIWYC